MSKTKKIKDLDNLPIAVDGMDTNVQKAIGEIPLACPICKAPVDQFNVTGSFSYHNEFGPDVMIIPTYYTWEGRCNFCYISWDLTIRKRGY